MNHPRAHAESLHLEGQTVLLALEPSTLIELLAPQLQEAGLEFQIAASLEDAIQKLTFSPPNFLILCEGFSTRQAHLNPLLAFVAKMPSASRRNLIVVWISGSVKTRDYLTAYSLSVNLVVQPEYLSDLVRLLSETRQEALDLFSDYLELHRQEKR